MGAANCVLCTKNGFSYENKSSQTLNYSPYTKNIFPLLKEKNTSSFIIQSSSSISSNDISLEDFHILKILGSGASGNIYLVQKKTSGKLYALKAIKKNEISKKKQQEYAWNELFILKKHDCPYIANLKYSFQNEEFLFLVMDFLQGGDLFFHLRNESRFLEEKAAFYAAEILCALDHLHQNNYIYRDLKPENVLFDSKGHIKLIDFGLAKKLLIEKGLYTCNTLIGTPEYVAPEILMGKDYDYSVDYWDLGCIVYEMVVGKPPFFGKSVQETLRKIVEDKLDFEEYEFFLTAAARDVIEKLLEKDPKKRIKFEGLKKCAFFKNIDWEQMKKGELEPPFKPNIETEMDLKYFESRFIDRDLGGNILEVSNKEESQYLYDYYLNFSYKMKMESLK